MPKSHRVMLTTLTPADSQILWKWINSRQEVLLNAPYKPIAVSQHQAWLEKIQNSNDLVIFGIRLKKTQKLIGTCQLHSIHYIHRSAELQIRVGEPAYRGNGYGTEAVELLLDFAFKDLNLQRVYLHVFKKNESALRLYEKLGFAREGVLRKAAHIDGKYVDVIVMGILREEYARR